MYKKYASFNFQCINNLCYFLTKVITWQRFDVPRKIWTGVSGGRTFLFPAHITKGTGLLGLVTLATKTNLSTKVISSVHILIMYIAYCYSPQNLSVKERMSQKYLNCKPPYKMIISFVWPFPSSWKPMSWPITTYLIIFLTNNIISKQKGNLVRYMLQLCTWKQHRAK